MRDRQPTLLLFNHAHGLAAVDIIIDLLDYLKE